MKLRRAVVFSLAALALLAALWLVGGNAWATHREEQCDPAWTTEFGSLDDLKMKYPARETNGTAKKLEALTRETVFDLTPVVGSVEPEEMARWPEWNPSQGAVDFLLAQISKPETSIDPPPEKAIHFLEERRVAVDAIESVLIGGPPPEWAFDLSVPENGRRKPNALGQIRLQRILTARALAAEQRGHNEDAARSLEASWDLNESLRGRPEIIAALLSIAIARFQVGILRKVTVEEDVWGKRLATLDSRTVLLDTEVLGYRPKFGRTWWRYVLEEYGEASWFRRAWQVLEAPAHRVANVEYSGLMRDELSHLRDAPLSDHFPEPPAPKYVYIRNSFLRADRLVVDVELTSKILEAKRLRRETGGRWPTAIPGIETSRYPGASWRYEASPDGGRMSIAFSRELASPYGTNTPGTLPLSFSSN